LLYDNSGNQKTGNYKKDIDPYKAGNYFTNSGMKKNDKNNS